MSRASVLAALALGMTLSAAPLRAAEPGGIAVAQMARDVTDAIRAMRKVKRARPPDALPERKRPKP
jgi:hypothetical protein